MFTKIVTSALIAGFGAGLFAAVLQFAFVQPILLHAELFETGALTHFGEIASAASVPLEGGSDLMRNALSVVFSALIYTGYALVALAVMVMAEERGHPLTARTGLIWGVAGFISVILAPAFSLAPELPGMAAADVTTRQIWWFATVIATGLGLWFLAFGASWPVWGMAIALIAAPHVIGAPMPDVLTGPAPPELGALFSARVIGNGLAVWSLLGVLLGLVWNSKLVNDNA